MILEEETFDAFGYYPSKLKQRSGKSILAACELCGEFRITSKDIYRSFCKSCALKYRPFSEETKLRMSTAKKGKKHPMFGKHSWNFGKYSTEETKAKLSAAKKGKKPSNYGKHVTEETKLRMSDAQKGKKHPNYGKRGEESTNYKGGKKVAKARNYAKRKRDLGYELLMPLKEGEVGHHLTNWCVIGIPKEVHVHFGGYTRQKHRTFILQWLKANDKKKYNLVLCVLAKQSLH